MLKLGVALALVGFLAWSVGVDACCCCGGGCGCCCCRVCQYCCPQPPIIIQPPPALHNVCHVPCCCCRPCCCGCCGCGGGRKKRSSDPLERRKIMKLQRMCRDTSCNCQKSVAPFVPANQNATMITRARRAVNALKLKTKKTGSGKPMSMPSVCKC